MTNHFTVSLEKFRGEDSVGYLIGIPQKDMKDLAVQFLKLQYGKLETIKLFDRSGADAFALIHRDRIAFPADGCTVSLGQTNVEFITSFLLDATDEYMNYDPIDLEFPTEKLDVSLVRIEGAGGERR